MIDRETLLNECLGSAVQYEAILQLLASGDDKMAKLFFHLLSTDGSLDALRVSVRALKEWNAHMITEITNQRDPDADS